MRLVSVVIFAASVVACGRHEGVAPRNVAPPEITAILDNSMQFVLLSIDPLAVNMRNAPAGHPQEVFHGHAVLGKTEIRDKAQRAALLESLYKGIGESDGKTVHMCFNPRHGIHATNGNTTVDLLICFECWQMLIYTHDRERMLTTTESPQTSFDKALKAAHIPLAPPGPNQAMQSTTDPRTGPLSDD